MLLFSVMFARTLGANSTQFWIRWVGCSVWDTGHTISTVDDWALGRHADDEADVISFKYCLKRYNLIENKMITDFDTSTRHQWGLCSRTRPTFGRYRQTCGIRFLLLLFERTKEKQRKCWKWMSMCSVSMAEASGPAFGKYLFNFIYSTKLKFWTPDNGTLNTFRKANHFVCISIFIDVHFAAVVRRIFPTYLFCI